MVFEEKQAKRNNRQVEMNFNLVIVGGGLSGICCAIAAARNGCKVGLIQDRPVLGGNASSEVRVWALGATSHMGNNNRWAREGGVIGEIMVENMHRNREGNPLLFDALLLEKVLHERNITLLLNTVVYDVEKSEDDILRSVVAFNPQNQTLYKVTANYFCDASGDGILGYLAGASYRFGAEEAEEFKEGFSPSDEYGKLLGHTIFLYSKKTNAPVKYTAPDFAIKDMTVIPKLHQITPDQYGCNYWWFEFGGEKDTIYESEDIKMELWRVVYGAWNYIKNSGKFPEAENLTLEWVGVIPGKRESRRFEGLYMLTQHDIVEQTVFDDAVAYGGWAIDLHPAKGVYASAPSCNQYHSEGVYSIPYRSFVSKDVRNLCFVGRLISASHVAFGSTRVMITSGLGGQAIGAAFALCNEKGCYPADLLNNGGIKELQHRLNLAGQSIPMKTIEQKDNLLAGAEIVASSVLKLSGLPFDGEWRPLVYSIGELLPLKKGVKYSFEVELKSEEETELTVDLVVSEKSFNYTPNKVLQSKRLSLQKGCQMMTVSFEQGTEYDQYAFVIFRANESVAIRLSKERLTGVLSVFNKFNKAVNNLGCQMPPEGSGFKSFEFFTPERRPEGHNIAFKVSPAIECFGTDNLVNGFTRPFVQPNAWIADFKDECPELIVNFGQKRTIRRMKLYFDTDFDHPMETIQWNHPESDMPFCVREFSVLDEIGNEIYSTDGNYQTITDIELYKPMEMERVKFKFAQSDKNIPVSVFQIEIL